MELTAAGTARPGQGRPGRPGGTGETGETGRVPKAPKALKVSPVFPVPVLLKTAGIHMPKKPYNY